MELRFWQVFGAKKFARISLHATLRKLFFASAIFELAIGLMGCASPFSKNDKSSVEGIQEITDEIVESSKKSLKPKDLCTIVADPHTGKILAMKGNATRFLTEPVSTIKAVSIVAAWQ